LAATKEISTELTECTEWEDNILLILPATPKFLNEGGFILSKIFAEKQEYKEMENDNGRY